MSKQISERKAAPIVKCKYCDWKGSARGLFAHVRLGHPGIKEKPPVMSHPLDINKPSSSIGSLPIKKNKGRKSHNISLEDMAIAAFVIWLLKKGMEQNNKQKQTLLSRVHKLHPTFKKPTEKELDEIVESLAGLG
jgi:hypothetical protein